MQESDRPARFARLARAASLIAVLASPAPAPAQTATPFTPPTVPSTPSGITVGPDGNVWFTEIDGNNIGRITLAGVITEFPIPSAFASPASIVLGADGNLWFTETGVDQIANITPVGVVTEFPLPPTPDGSPIAPIGIAAGADGNIWFTEFSSNKIGRITPGGIVTEFPLPSPIVSPGPIAAGPDGNLWFVASNNIGRITTAGVITIFGPVAADSVVGGITAGSDGALWFTSAKTVSRITTAGVFNTLATPTATGQFNDILAGADGALWFYENAGSTSNLWRLTTAGAATKFPLLTPVSNVFGMTVGPDGNIWFTLDTAGRVVEFQPSSSTVSLFAATLPASRSVQVGKTATAFATILNAGSVAVTGCQIVPITTLPASFLYQTTNPTTNVLTGSPNTPAPIAAGGSQSFLVAYGASAPQVSINAALGFSCAGVNAAPTLVGVDTLVLAFDANPVPDMIAVGLTPSNDGFSHTGGVGGTGLFAVAASNIGAATSLTARARLLNASTPLTTFVCETDPVSGQCKAAPAATVTRTINQNENSTWSAFLQATATIAPDPAHARVMFEFVDAGGVVRGSTSTAVTTGP